MTNQLPRFDFRSPQRISPGTFRDVRHWLNDAGPGISDALEAMTRTAWTYELSDIALADARKFVAELPQPGIGMSVNSRGLKTFMGVDKRLTWTLVDLLVGSEPTEMSEDRDLSGLELRMVELALQQVLQAIGETAPTLRQQFLLEEATTKPSRTRLFQPEEALLRATLKLVHQTVQMEIHWLLRQEQLNLVFQRPTVAPSIATSTPSPAIVNVASRIPLTSVVELGRTELRMSEVSKLCPGDVVILNHGVRDDLTVHVEGLPKFTGRPGRVGLKRAVVVQSATTDQT